MPESLKHLEYFTNIILITRRVGIVLKMVKVWVLFISSYLWLIPKLSKVGKTYFIMEQFCNSQKIGTTFSLVNTSHEIV